MTGLDDRLAALSPEKRALFERLLAERGRTEDVFPISVTQQGIWFFEQLRPGNPAYVVPAAARIRGPLDVAVLRAALAGVVARHESLRTTFEVRDGRPVQVVRPRPAVEVPETDLRLPGTGDPDAELADAVLAALAGPFDLATGPLLRVRLLRLGPGDAVLAVAMHHLVSDGWSVGVLLSELSTRYAALAAGREPDLPDLPVQYGDFAGWQHAAVRGPQLTADLAHWRAHLAGAPPVLELPTDRPRPPVQGFRGGSVPFELPEPLMRALSGIARRRGATPYMGLLAVLQVLLHRWAGTDDVVVGVPAANRGRAEVEPLIGFFVNILPVRTDVGGDPAFGELLDRVREACLGAYAHQGVPFELVVADLQLPRDLSRPPVFQVSLSYQSDPLPSMRMAGVELTRLPLPSQGARFDLELQLFDDAGAVSGWFEYDRDLFDAATIERLAGHFRRLVELVAADPDARIDQLELLSAGERAEVLAAGGGPERDWPGQGWIHECVRDRARRAPAAEAVRFEGVSVSYAELDRRANQLAHRLRRLGVRPGVLVGVCMHRSVELVVGLLAVLKAGGAYVPLDPDLPPARLATLLADIAAPVLLTQAALAGGLPPTGAAVLALDALAGELAAEPADDPGVAVDGEDAAYVIHTSGSTGPPKGVVNVHAAIRNRLLWMQDAYRLDGTDRVLQKTPYSFDVSVWEFFWPLMVGATLVVARPDGHRDPAYLMETLRAERISTVHFVPSMLRVLLHEPGLEDRTALRRVICSGEALPADVARRFLARSTAELHNLYGPTEAAVDVTAWQCWPDGGPVPLGFPIANVRVHVLDGRLRPVPVGVPGELYLGGRGLARGYLGRPGLTADRFVPDPYGPPGARLYRTGDLGRLRPDGALDYLGRLDDQVKVRGFRVEPGEIAAALGGHPGVGEAVVTARGDRLVAYLTAADPAAPPAAGDLRAHLTGLLPEHLVPAAYVLLPALPVTANGKLDRAALPEPDGSRPELRTAYVAPTDDLERALAGLWRELLGVERVGAEDNFFDLGGHSLLMAELRARLAGSLGHEVSLVELFQYPTVGSLAAHLARAAAGGGGTALAGRDRAGSRRELGGRLHDRRQALAARRADTRNGG